MKARLFRGDEWSVVLNDDLEWESNDAPLLLEAIQLRWERVDLAPQFGNVVTAFVEKAAKDFACDYEITPEEPDDDEILRLY